MLDVLDLSVFALLLITLLKVSKSRSAEEKKGLTQFIAPRSLYSSVASSQVVR